jgi:hypothetical protein
MVTKLYMTFKDCKWAVFRLSEAKPSPMMHIAYEATCEALRGAFGSVVRHYP